MPGHVMVELGPDVPDFVSRAAQAVLDHQGSRRMDEIAGWREEIPESRYAENLVQLNNGKQIPSDPSMWCCEESGVNENLWLNLSTGYIGSGRPNWDGTGGTGAALRHFEETGKKYPLVVKLGTITPRGADVFSYADDENDMVLDPLLPQHLAHWGINMIDQRKTEKTMVELQIDLNQTYEFDKIMESSKMLQPIRGPGYVGLENLGNSCYMNALIQVLFSLEETSQRYLALMNNIRRTSLDPTNDIPAQMVKLAEGLLTDRYIPNTNLTDEGDKETEKQATSICPSMFRAIATRGHAEFSSGHQQDALEFLQHLLTTINKSERLLFGRLDLDSSAVPLSDIFAFQVETRLQCLTSSTVKYMYQEDNVLSLNIPIECAINHQQVLEYSDREAKRQKLKGSGNIPISDTEEPVKLRVPLLSCLECFATKEVIDDFYSSAVQQKTQALKSNRIKTFPPYLIFHMKRYYRDTDWTEKKLDVLIEVPENIDLTFLRGAGLAPGEEQMPEDEGEQKSENCPARSQREPDAGIVAQLVAMGFSENGSKRAVLATGNADAETSMAWVLNHMDDPDFNDPVPVTNGTALNVPDPNAIAMIASMGFNDRQAQAALKACQGDLERAADWLYSRIATLNEEVESVLTDEEDLTGIKTQENVRTFDDGTPSYTLKAFVSHIGSNTACGHYVAHIKKEGSWILFNDDKVAISKRPPFELGYLYFYERTRT
uniref:Ubiquitin carboxyl-terminal hydrolase n=1 Tax=Compsopogon caeruleus TaxID=31354 RepID=A0A7S1TC20_9RHOD